MGIKFEFFESLDIAFKKYFLCWVVSCGRMTLALYLILLRILLVWKARLHNKNIEHSIVSVSESILGTGDIGDGG